MAKYEWRLCGDFDDTLHYFHERILNESTSASYEDEGYAMFAGVRCCVRVYERYSFSGGNRLTLTVMLVGDGEELYLSAITSGGSQGMLLKFNTFGEQSFLNEFRDIVDQFRAEHRITDG